MSENGSAAAHDELYLIDGSSLAYRAFFALPESIATSTGVPTNAIFGFASMLVKLLTEHGQKPTIVVWDAGHSGRKDVSADYKSTRQSRPDLLREQWPHLAPLVEAFGYKNVSVDGYEADDVIASIAEKARAQDVPVVIVTGDRDIFQLIDPDSKVRVMATGRGITDTKLYDYQAVIDRYGLAPEKIPDFYGLKGDTSDNIPGVPGIGDKTASQLLQQYGDLEGVLSNIENISGAKRKENLTNHADDARMSKQLATAVTDVDVDIDLAGCVDDPPDRSRLREVFREFELRAPLERLEEALGEEGVESLRAQAQVEIETRAREIAPSGLAELEGELLALAAERPTPEEEAQGELLAPPPEPLRFAAFSGGDEVLVGEAETLAAITMAWGDKPVVAHDWKSIASAEEPCDAPPLEHDTMVAAYLLDPAGRAYPLLELTERDGIGARVQGANGLAERAVL